MEAAFFYVLSFVAIGSSVIVVTDRRPTYGVLALTVAMIALSGLFVLLRAYFVAIIQVLIYAGAILVLFLFVIMLLGISTQTPLENEKQKKTDALRNKFRLWVSLVLPTAFLMELSIAFLAVRDTGFIQKDFSGTVEAIGGALFGPYLLPFELISAILLIGIFGVVNLAQKELKNQ